MNRLFINSPIRSKLMLIIMITTGAVLFLASIAFVINEAITYRAEVREEINVLASVIAKNASVAIASNNRKAAKDIISGVSVNSRILAVYVTDVNGSIFSQYVAPDKNEFQRQLRPLYVEIAPKKIRYILKNESTGSGSLLDRFFYIQIKKSIVLDKKVVGSVAIEAYLTGFLSKLKMFLCQVVAILFAATLIAYLLSLRMQGAISHPIIFLAKTMKKVTANKDYSIRSPKTTGDEIGVLSDAFNEMLSQIEARDDILNERQEHLDRLAHYDTLTHLPNRILFHDRLTQTLHQAARTQQKVAVLFIDLDHFKDVNDSYGHKLGDLLLQEVAARLKAIARACDTVARMSGDEFTYFLQDVKQPENAGIVARKIIQTLSESYLIDNRKIFVSASVGISIYPDDGTAIEDLMKNADMAMYHAKENGKNQFQYYSHEINSKKSRRIEVINNLHQALESNSFILHYQPKMEIKSGTISGLEALLRWNHPEQGMILPDKFIPIAEDSGMIVPIGEWVLEAVCNQINMWDQMKLKQKSVAINVSAVQLRKDDFADTVIDIIRKSNIDPKCLEFELTESSIMTDVDKAVEKLRRLRDIGIKISIDDFGTGFSSLSQLRRFPIDRLKIDKSFISNITNSSDDLIIVSAIINMAKSLNLKITAEGVETKEQLKILTEHGCHEMQGFLYGKPMTEDMIRHYIKFPERTRGTSFLMHPPLIQVHHGQLGSAPDHDDVPFAATPALGKSNVLPFRTAA